MTDHILAAAKRISAPQSLVLDGVRFALNQFGRGQDRGVAEALRLAPELHTATRGQLTRHIETELSYVRASSLFSALWSPVVDALRSAPVTAGTGIHEPVSIDERLVVDAIRFSLGRRTEEAYTTATALTGLVDQLSTESLNTLVPLLVKRLSVELRPVMRWDDAAPWDIALRTINARLGEPLV